jgi:hypothetical protein
VATFAKSFAVTNYLKIALKNVALSLHAMIINAKISAEQIAKIIKNVIKNVDNLYFAVIIVKMTAI